MTLSALIRKRDTGNLATAIPAIPATQPKGDAATVARVATVAVANPKEEKTAPLVIVGAGDATPVSRWWRLHYPDREPAEVACFPDMTHAEILARYPEAIAAEPFQDSPRLHDDGSTDTADFPWSEPEAHNPPPQPVITACKSCAHVCRSGCCGAPIAAGLSELEGVIRYHPGEGIDCPAWQAQEALT